MNYYTITLSLKFSSFCFIQRYKISVYRRYSDFDVFHEVLLQRFAYRVVPALPPKRMLKGGRSGSLFLHRIILQFIFFS